MGEDRLDKLETYVRDLGEGVEVLSNQLDALGTALSARRAFVDKITAETILSTARTEAAGVLSTARTEADHLVKQVPQVELSKFAFTYLNLMTVSMLFVLIGLDLILLSR